MQDRPGSYNWTDLKDVHLFISETHKILPYSNSQNKGGKKWLPTAIRLMPTLQKMIWVEDIESRSSFAAADDSSLFVPADSDGFLFSGGIIAILQSPHGVEAVLWWEYSDQPPSSCPDVFVYSAAAGEELVITAAGEELVIKAAGFHTARSYISSERSFYCRHVRCGVLRRPEPMCLGANCNATIARTDGTFLWLRTRQECVCDNRGTSDWRMIIDISITTFDHSKI